MIGAHVNGKLALRLSSYEASAANHERNRDWHALPNRTMTAPTLTGTGACVN
jgi:hypothetical protein